MHRGRAVDGELELSAVDALHEVELLLVLPYGIELVEGAARIVLRLEPGERRTLPAQARRCARWGAYRLGTCVVRVRDRFGLVVPRRPPPETVLLRASIRGPSVCASSFGRSRRSRSSATGSRAPRGEGIEFADLRPFAHGDRVRRINWRASARRGELWVNEQHHERNSDVVLFLDSFAEVRRQRDGTLDLAVRAAAALASEYLARRDRVGVVGFGGSVSWLAPVDGHSAALPDRPMRCSTSEITLATC